VTIGRALGVAAFVIGACAAIAGSAAPPAPRQAVADDRVSAQVLTEWLRAKKAGLRVIDLRPIEAFDAYHIPGAEDVPIATITKAEFARTETVVLYADTEIRAEQAWVTLRARGLTNVHILRGGLAEWPGLVSARRRGC
jgi:rhodanese-related sulfurtransferase